MPPRVAEDLSGLQFDLKYGRRQPTDLSPSESAAVDLSRGVVTFDQLTDEGQAMVRADWPFLAPVPSLGERAMGAAGSALGSLGRAVAPIGQGATAVGREAAETVSRIPRLVTEGLPAAGRAFVKSQVPPTLGQELRQRGTVSEPQFGGPPKEPTFAERVLFGGISPLPAILDIGERASRLPRSIGRAAAELGPEQAKPLTEAIFANVPFLGPAGARALATDIRAVRGPRFQLPEMPPAPAPREALVRGFQEPPPILPGRGIPKETEQIISRRPVPPEPPAVSQAEVAAKRAGMDLSVPTERPTAILDAQGRPMTARTPRSPQPIEKQYAEAKERVGVAPRSQAQVPELPPPPPAPLALARGVIPLPESSLPKVPPVPPVPAFVPEPPPSVPGGILGESGAFIPGAGLFRRPPPPTATPAARAASEADVLEAFAGEPPGRMTKVVDVLGRNLVPNYKWNEEAVAIFRERRGGQAFLAEEARAGQRQMLEQQKAAGLGPGDLGQTLKGLSDNPEAQAIIRPWRERIDRNAQELASRGLLNPETAQANLGRYARRVYLRDILGKDYVPPPQAVDQARAYLRQNLEISGRPATDTEIEGVIRSILQPKSPMVLSLRGRPRIPLDPVKRRKDIPVEIRQLMGEVEDGSYLAARTVMDQESMLINDDFFRKFREGSEPMVVAGERVQMPWVRETPAPGYRQIPDAKPYGALRNVHVLDKYADEIVAMGRGETGSALLETYFDYINLFKVSKTALNPATHARNITGNLAFADFAGIAPWDPRSAPSYRRAFRAIAEGPSNPMFREAMQFNAIGAEMVGPDIQKLGHTLQDMAAHRGVFGTLRDLGSHGIDRVGRIYNQEDQIFKLASFIRQRSLGMSPREAAAHVNTWFPNYAEVAPVIRNLRGSERTVGGAVAASVGNPFASFKAEAIRIAANAVREHPLKLAKWMAAPIGLTYASMAAMGVSPEDARRAFRRLPDFMQQPYTVLLPWKDDRGNLQFWDMTYFHFLGDLFGANPRTPAMRDALGPDNPITATGGALVTSFLGGSPFVVGALQLLNNRDFFTGQEAVRFPITTAEGIESLGRSIGEDVLPVPPLLTRGVESVRLAAKGLPGRFGERLTVPQAVGESITGFRAISTGPEMRRRGAVTLRGQMNELQREIFRAARNPDRPRARRDVEALRRKVDALIQQYSGPTVAERTAIPFPLGGAP